MIEMFKHYISPSSPARAKLAIHLHAKAVSDASMKNGISVSEYSNVPYIIKDVREYKSRLAITAGPQPVNDLSEFEDIDAKLCI